MSSFRLSPGITPELTDLFVVVVPLAVGFGYLLWRRRGFELAFALSAIVLGGIKLYTDSPDLPDDVVAGSAILAGVLWALLATGAFRIRRGSWIPVAVLGGFVKLRDFYDPFDLLLADCIMVAGLAIVLYARGRLTPPSESPDAEQSSSAPTGPSHATDR
jgi:hypothetical protein